MSDNPLGSPQSRRADTGARDGTTVAAVTVRLTESATRHAPALEELYDADARVEFPSVNAAYAFEDALTRAVDGHEYLLTPDHQSDATFFLRCQVVGR